MANISSIGGNPIVPAAVQPNSITDAMLAQTGGVLSVVRELGITHYNLFNPSTISEGKYLNNAGGLSDNASFFASDYIDVSGHDTIVLSYTHLISWYEADGTFITMDPNKASINSDVIVTVPQDAKWLRFSTYNTYLSQAQIGPNVTRSAYIPYRLYYLSNLRQDESVSTITVDAAGGGDYTSFTEAVYETVESMTDIVVKPGTYDIEAEYVALFGQDVVDNLADSTTGINDFQYGIRVHDRTITFEAGAHLVCDWSDRTVDGTHRFCVFRIEPNAKLIGLDLDCTHTFYCIHDDYGTSDDSPFTVEYEDCRIIGHNLVNANCIGGGCHKYSRHIIRNCYFDNNRTFVTVTDAANVRYHNTATAGAEPEVYVSDCYFSNNLNFSYYGSQTTKMRAYVNNCYAPHGINKVAESSSSTVDNVEIYKWNNVESA